MKKVFCMVSAILVLTWFHPCVSFARIDRTNYSAIIQEIEEAFAYANEISSADITGGLFSYYKVYGNKTGFIVHCAIDGASLSAKYIKLGLFDRSESWEIFNDAISSYSPVIYNILSRNGIKNPNLLFMLVDEENNNEPLLVLYNNFLIFDTTLTEQ